MPLLIALAVVVALLIARRRFRRRADRTDALLVSREDRTGYFPRSPGRLHGNGGL